MESQIDDIARSLGIDAVEFGAVANAVRDAIGARLDRLPMNPSRVLSSLTDAEKGLCD